VNIGYTRLQNHERPVPLPKVNVALKRYFFLALITVALSACIQLNTFEHTVQIPGHSWSYNNQPEVSFNITDTSATYNVFITLRHTDAYAYKNIWLNIATRQPGDSSYRKERFELTLQQADGRWLGTGLSDIWEVRHPLFSNVKFKKSGTYSIRLRQIMRDNPLQHIMNAGVRIEKAKS
jgi:gliding motility-associated lipoprotein GldH